MKKNVLLVGVMALALSLSVVACDSSSSTTDDSSNSETTTSEDGEFDAVEAYWGQWRGSVETTGETVYGTAGGTEPMLDVYLEEDGSCTVEPLEAHADLLTDEGTWEGTEDTITLHLSSGDIVLTVVSGTTLEGDAADFDIADFDTINFDFYG